MYLIVRQKGRLCVFGDGDDCGDGDGNGFGDGNDFSDGSGDGDGFGGGAKGNAEGGGGGQGHVLATKAPSPRQLILMEGARYVSTTKK